MEKVYFDPPLVDQLVKGMHYLAFYSSVVLTGGVYVGKVVFENLHEYAEKFSKKIDPRDKIGTEDSASTESPEEAQEVFPDDGGSDTSSLDQSEEEAHEDNQLSTGDVDELR